MLLNKNKLLGVYAFCFCLNYDFPSNHLFYLTEFGYRCNRSRKGNPAIHFCSDIFQFLHTDPKMFPGKKNNKKQNRI